MDDKKSELSEHTNPFFPVSAAASWSSVLEQLYTTEVVIVQMKDEFVDGDRDSVLAMLENCEVFRESNNQDDG